MNSKPAPRKRAKSPYQRYKKRPYDYSAMYRRVLDNEPTSAFAQHLRRMRGMQ